MLKLLSWNVNGLRACVKKGFMDFFTQESPDILCLQETKLQEGQLELDTPGWTQIFCSAEKKGYSGTAVFSKTEPLSVSTGVGVPELDGEGRVICAEFDGFYLVNVYTPNAQDGLKRLDFRMAWDDAFRAALRRLDAKKPVVACGDFNVAHNEIDLKNPKENRGNAGFSDEEREKFGLLLDAGFTDSFRFKRPDEIKYSWWSYRMRARERNAGWRIDYFLTSDRLREAIAEAEIRNDVFGSDHCPVELLLDI